MKSTNRQLQSRDFFKVQASCMRYIGVWPGVINHTIQAKHMRTLVVHTLLSLVALLFEFWTIKNHMGELQLQLEILCVTGMRMITTAKMIVVTWKRYELHEMLLGIDETVVNDPEPIAKKINHQMWKLESLSSLGLFVLFIVASTVYFLLPILRIAVTRVNNWQLPLQIDIPFDYQSYTRYPITYLVYSYICWLIPVTYVGVDGLFVGCCLYVSGQFKIIKQNINELGAKGFVSINNDLAMFTVRENQGIKRKLATTIIRHIKCIELSEHMVQCFEQMLIIQFFLCSLVLSVYCILLRLAGTIWETMLYSNCIVAGFFHMFMFCKCGTFLTDSSSDIVDAVYNLDWYKCDKDVKVMIQFMIMRSQKPCEIRAPFVVATMETFGNILNSTFSLITLLTSFL